MPVAEGAADVEGAADAEVRSFAARTGTCACTEEARAQGVAAAEGAADTEAAPDVEARSVAARFTSKKAPSEPSVAFTTTS